MPSKRKRCCATPWTACRKGFVIFDKDDRLVLCNEAYRRMYPASAHLMVPGVKFETLVRNTLVSGHYPDAARARGGMGSEFLRIHSEAVDELETQQQEGAGFWFRNAGCATAVWPDCGWISPT